MISHENEMIALHPVVVAYFSQKPLFHSSAPSVIFENLYLTRYFPLPHLFVLLRLHLFKKQKQNVPEKNLASCQAAEKQNGPE